MNSVSSNAVAFAIDAAKSKNFGNTWSGTGTTGWANYINLGNVPAGKYVLIIKSSGVDSVAVQTASTNYYSAGSGFDAALITISSAANGLNVAAYSNPGRSASIMAALLQIA